MSKRYTINQIYTYTKYLSILGSDLDIRLFINKIYERFINTTPTVVGAGDQVNRTPDKFR